MRVWCCRLGSAIAVVLCGCAQPILFSSRPPSRLTPLPEPATKPGMTPHPLEAVPFHDPQTARQNFEGATLKLSPELAKALPGLLAESPDPDSAILFFERLVSEASQEILRLLERH